MLIKQIKHRLEQLEFISALFILLVAIGYVIWSVTILWQLRIPGVWLDYWSALDFVKEALNNEVGWVELFSPYAGAHRLVLPRILFYLDARYFSLTNQFLFDTALLLHSASLAFFVIVILKQNKFSVISKMLLLATLCFYFFSVTQWFNLMYPWDVQWFCALFFSLTAIALSLFYGSFFKSPWFLFLLFVLVVLAGLCQFIGFISGFVVALSLFWSKQKKSSVLFFCFVLALIWLYLPNSKDTNEFMNISWYSIPFIIPSMTLYILKYLSSPLSREFLFVGSLLAFVSGFLVLICSYYATRDAYKNNKTIRFFLLLSWFIIAVAAATYLGRGWQPNSATAERYQTVSLLYWVALTFLLYLIGDYFSNTYKRFIPWVSLCLVFIILMPAQQDNFKSLIHRLDANKQSQIAYKSGFTSVPEVGRMMLFTPKDLSNYPPKVYFDWLNRAQLGAFSGDRINREDIPRVTPICDGLIFTVKKIAKGYEISGVTKQLFNKNNILLFWGDNHGYGAYHLLPKQLYPLSINTEKFYWRGYIKTVHLKSQVNMLEVFFHDDTWCKLSS